jgi:hypothetical protein
MPIKPVVSVAVVAAVLLHIGLVNAAMGHNAVVVDQPRFVVRLHFHLVPFAVVHIVVVAVVFVAPLVDGPVPVDMLAEAIYQTSFAVVVAQPSSLLLVAVGHGQSMEVLVLLRLYSRSPFGLVLNMVDGIVVIELEDWSLQLKIFHFCNCYLRVMLMLLSG